MTRTRSPCIVIMKHLRYTHVYTSNNKHLHSLLSLRLNRQEAHRHERSEKQGTGRINRCHGVRAGIDTNNRGHESRNPVQAAGNTRSGAAVRRREDLRRVGVQDAVHDHLEERLQRRAHELDVRVLRGREAEEQDAGDQGRAGHCAFSADVLDIDEAPGEEGAGDAADGGDGVVAVGDVG